MAQANPKNRHVTLSEQALDEGAGVSERGGGVARAVRQTHAVRLKR